MLILELGSKTSLVGQVYLVVYTLWGCCGKWGQATQECSRMLTFAKCPQECRMLTFASLAFGSDVLTSCPWRPAMTPTLFFLLSDVSMLFIVISY